MYKKAQKRHYKEKKRNLKTLRLLGEIKLYPATSAGSKNTPKCLPEYYPRIFKNAGVTLFRLFDPNKFSGIISAAFSFGQNDISDIPVDHRRPREYP